MHASLDGPRARKSVGYGDVTRGAAEMHKSLVLRWFLVIWLLLGLVTSD
jgi:hypothetical protein